MHPAELSLIVGSLAQQYANDYNAAHPENTISERQAETILIDQALVQVDNKWASQLPEDDEARAWLQEHTAGMNLSNEEQVFTATDAEKANWNLYSQPYANRYADEHMGQIGIGLSVDTSKFGTNEYGAVADSIRGDATMSYVYQKLQSGQPLTQDDWAAWHKYDDAMTQIFKLAVPPAGIAYDVKDGNYTQAAIQTAGLLMPSALEAGVLNVATKTSSVYDMPLWQSLGTNADGSVGIGLSGDEAAGSIRNVNPGFPIAGRTQNCVNCSIATDATLSGRPATALPSDGPVPISVLEQQFGGKFGPASTADDVEQQLLEAGNGSRGIIFGSRGPGETGHVFNVVNQDGVIRFLDGQTGQQANLSGYTNLHLLRTN